MIVAIFSGDIGNALKILAFLALPLACIWFGESMGGYTRLLPRGVYISKTSSEGFVVLLGWVLLLFPLIVAIIYIISNKGGF